MANIANMHRPIFNAQLFAGVELLSGYRSNWNTKKQPFTLPMIIGVSDPSIQSLSGLTVTYDYYDFMRKLSSWVKLWQTYLTGTNVTLQEYQNGIQQFELWYQGVYSELSTSGHSTNQGYYVNPDRGEFYFFLRDALNPARKAIADAGNAVVARQKALAVSAGQFADENAASAKARDNMISYYQAATDNLIFITTNASISQRFRSWQSAKESKEDEEMRWNDVVNRFTNNDKAAVTPFRQAFYDAYWEALPTINAKLNAEVDLKNQQVPGSASFGTSAITSKMRTGLWSQVESELLEVTNAEIRQAAYNMDLFRKKLEEVLPINDKDRKKQVRDAVIPQAEAYARGISKGVSTTALWMESVRNYNAVLIQLNKQLGESTTNWGLILALGAAGIGGLMFLT